MYFTDKNDCCNMSNFTNYGGSDDRHGVGEGFGAYNGEVGKAFFKAAGDILMEDIFGVEVTRVDKAEAPVGGEDEIGVLDVPGDEGAAALSHSIFDEAAAAARAYGDTVGRLTAVGKAHDLTAEGGLTAPCELGGGERSLSRADVAYGFALIECEGFDDGQTEFLGEEVIHTASGAVVACVHTESGDTVHREFNGGVIG